MRFLFTEESVFLCLFSGTDAIETLPLHCNPIRVGADQHYQER
jgi:hypothetical protein